MHYKTAKANTSAQTEQRRLLRNNATTAEATLCTIRTSYLDMQGIRVFRFDNSQVLTNPEWVVSEIIRIGKEICDDDKG